MSKRVPLLILTAVAFFNGLDRNVFFVLAPQIQKDLHFSDTELGLIAGFGFSLFYGLCALPIARLADRFNRRNLLAISVGVWSVATAATGAATSVLHLFLARASVGAAESGAVPTSQSLICDYNPPDRRSRAFSILNVGLLLGAMSSYWIVAFLGSLIGWRAVFLVLGPPGIALGLVVRYCLNEPPRGAYDPLASGTLRPSIADTLARMWTCRTYRMLVLAIICYAASFAGLIGWAPTFYTRVYGADLSRIGIVLGLSMALAPAVGILIGGWVADFLAKKAESTPLRVASLCSLAAAPMAAISIFLPSALGSMLLLGLASLLASAFWGYMVASMTALLLPRARATGQAILALLTTMLATGLGPAVVGAASDLFTPWFGTEALRYALLFPVSIIPLLAVFQFLASQSISRDLQENQTPLPDV